MTCCVHSLTAASTLALVLCDHKHVTAAVTSYNQTVLHSTTYTITYTTTLRECEQTQEQLRAASCITTGVRQSSRANKGVAFCLRAPFCSMCLHRALGPVIIYIMACFWLPYALRCNAYVCILIYMYICVYVALVTYTHCASCNGQIRFDLRSGL